MPGFESGVLYEILDCATNRILPVPHRLDSVVRFALPLRAPAPESLPGMHLPHLTRRSRSSRPASWRRPSASRFRAALTSRSCKVPHFGHFHCRSSSPNSSSVCRHAEQVLLEGYQRSTWTRILLYQRSEEHTSELQS